MGGYANPFAAMGRGAEAMDRPEPAQAPAPSAPAQRRRPQMGMAPAAQPQQRRPQPMQRPTYGQPPRRYGQPVQQQMVNPRPAAAPVGRQDVAGSGSQPMMVRQGQMPAQQRPPGMMRYGAPPPPVEGNRIERLGGREDEYRQMLGQAEGRYGQQNEAQSRAYEQRLDAALSSGEITPEEFAQYQSWLPQNMPPQGRPGLPWWGG